MTHNNTTVSNWPAEFNCKDMDTAIFFPTTKEETRDARAICNACPARSACIELAYSFSGNLTGMFGGILFDNGKILSGDEHLRPERTMSKKSAATLAKNADTSISA